MTYDQMMNLTIEQLKEGKITDGACTKILLNIKKLKERPAMLQKLITEIDRDQIDLKNILQQLHELMLTPIRAKQGESEKDHEEDLPSLIMQVLEKGKRRRKRVDLERFEWRSLEAAATRCQFDRTHFIISHHCSLPTFDSKHLIDNDLIRYV